MLVFKVLWVLSLLVCIAGGLMLAIKFCNLLTYTFAGTPVEINVSVFITGALLFVIGAIGTVCFKAKK